VSRFSESKEQGHLLQQITGPFPRIPLFLGENFFQNPLHFGVAQERMSAIRSSDPEFLGRTDGIPPDHRRRGDRNLRLGFQRASGHVAREGGRLPSE